MACIPAALLLAAVPDAARAGGADVSSDEIYSDGVTLRSLGGAPLDINGDGNADLAVAANRDHPAGRSRYYPGNGDGTFAAPILLSDGASSEIVAADLNHDGTVDLVHARRDLTDLIYTGNGTGVDAPVNLSTDATRVLSIAVGDLDNDGDLDIVTGNGHPGGIMTNPPQPNRFYLNGWNPGGTLTFTGSEISSDADDTRGIALADMDGDGDLDVIAGNDESTPGSNRIYPNRFVESGLMSVSFGEGVDFGPPDDQTSKILIGDLDNDGDPDIVVLNNVQEGASPGLNRYFLNENVLPGTLAIGPAMDVSPDTDKTNGGALVDFDGDGDLDLVVANGRPEAAGQSGRNRIYLNQLVETGSVGFSAGVDLSPDEYFSRSVAAADLDGDGNVDVVIGNQDEIPGVSGRDRRYLNNGSQDPFANIVPVIDAQSADLVTDEEAALAIGLDDLAVTDGDNVYPDDFSLGIQPGDGYTVNGTSITPDVGFAGQLTVPVIVNDGTDDSAAFDLTVTVNDTVDNTPTFSSTPVVTAREGQAYTYDVVAADADVGSTLTITAPVLPGWLTLADNGDGTATLSGTPAAAQVGAHDVTLEVSDGAASTTQNFTITVSAAPAPPSSGGSGGGSTGYLFLLALLLSIAGRLIRGGNTAAPKPVP